MTNPSTTSPRTVLSIAGSDSGGGAGIQADLKAFARAGVHGMTAITAITAQNTLGVDAVSAIPADVIVAQVRAVASDIGVDAVKIGMLGDEATILAVERALDLVGNAPVVLDPVMVAESGAVLLDPAAREALAGRLVPRATVVTPNLAEARELAAHAGQAAPDGRTDDREAADQGEAADDGEALARAVKALGPAAVVVTGGHAEHGDDIFFDGELLVRLRGECHPAGASHGSGCTHSSTLAARLALGDDPLEAAREARRVASEAVRDGLRDLGEGAGPVDVLGIARARR